MFSANACPDSLYFKEHATFSLSLVRLRVPLSLGFSNAISKCYGEDHEQTGADCLSTEQAEDTASPRSSGTEMVTDDSDSRPSIVHSNNNKKLSLDVSLSPPPFLSFAQSLSPSLSRFLSLGFCLILSVSRAPPLSLVYLVALPFTLFLLLLVSVSPLCSSLICLSVYVIHTRTRTRAHSQTHFFSLSLLLSPPIPISLSLSLDLSLSLSLSLNGRQT